MDIDFFASTSADVFNDQQTIEPKITQKAKKNKKAKKLDYKQSMAKAPESPFKCKTHTNQKLKLRTVTKGAPTCRSCGFKCEGLTGFLSCPESSNCFSICSVCRICPQNHILRNCASLKQYDQQELYAQNKFKCSSCEKQKSVGEDGVMHCGPCSFSICIKCMDDLSLIWERQQSEDKEELKEIKEDPKEE